MRYQKQGILTVFAMCKNELESGVARDRQL